MGGLGKGCPTGRVVAAVAPPPARALASHQVELSLRLGGCPWGRRLWVSRARFGQDPGSGQVSEVGADGHRRSWPQPVGTCTHLRAHRDSCHASPTPLQSGPLPIKALSRNIPSSPTGGSQVTHCQVPAWRPHGVQVQSSAAWGASKAPPGLGLWCWGGHGGRGCRAQPKGALHVVHSHAQHLQALQAREALGPGPGQQVALQDGQVDLRTGSLLQGVCGGRGGGRRSVL